MLGRRVKPALWVRLVRPATWGLREHRERPVQPVPRVMLVILAQRDRLAWLVRRVPRVLLGLKEKRVPLAQPAQPDLPAQPVRPEPQETLALPARRGLKAKLAMPDRLDLLVHRVKSDLQDLRERQVRLAARVPLGRLGQREPREIREPPAPQGRRD